MQNAQEQTIHSIKIVWILIARKSKTINRLKVYRPRITKKQTKDIVIRSLRAHPTNTNQLIIMDADTRGAIFDISTKKFVRLLPEFSGEITADGKLGIYAPAKGGLHVSARAYFGTI